MSTPPASGRPASRDDGVGAPGRGRVADLPAVLLDVLVEVLVLVLGPGVVGEVARVGGLDNVVDELGGLVELGELPGLVVGVVRRTGNGIVGVGAFRAVLVSGPARLGAV